MVNWPNSGAAKVTLWGNNGNHLHSHSVTMAADYFLVTVILGLKLQCNCLASIFPPILFSTSIFPILLNHNITSQPGSEQHRHSWCLLFQGCVLTELIGPRCPTFALLVFSYKSNARYPRFYGFRVPAVRLPSISLRAQPCISYNSTDGTSCLCCLLTTGTLLHLIFIYQGTEVWCHKNSYLWNYGIG